MRWNGKATFYVWWSMGFGFGFLTLGDASSALTCFAAALVIDATTTPESSNGGGRMSDEVETIELVSCADCGCNQGVRWPSGYVSYFDCDTYHEDNCPTFNTNRSYAKFSAADDPTSSKED